MGAGGVRERDREREREQRTGAIKRAADRGNGAHISFFLPGALCCLFIYFIFFLTLRECPSISRRKC